MGVKTEFLGKSTNGVFCVDGVDLFQPEWRTTGRCAVALDPVTGRAHTLSVYRIELGDEASVFAAGEFRQGEWSFFDCF